MFATVGSPRLTPFGSLFDTRARIALPVASIGGAAAAAFVAIAFLIMPIAVIEGMAVDSGIASIIPAAAPPLGLTARLAAAFFAALVVGGLTWFGLFLILGARTAMLRRGEAEDGVPVLRRADAHPDAPPRRPVFANRDLGTPFLDITADAPVEGVEEVEIEAPIAEARVVPADLDTPIASYWTPSAVPLPDPEPTFEPLAEVLPEPEVEPLPVLTPVSAPRFAAHERIETFGLAASDDETSKPLPQATIHDLLARLERGVAKRQPESEAPREPTLEETLDALRALARRVG